MLPVQYQLVNYVTRLSNKNAGRTIAINNFSHLFMINTPRFRGGAKLIIWLWRL
jgi:hypothetical protein